MNIGAVTLHNQTASPLLRLPPEIRDRIYHFALLYDGVVNIYPAPNGVDFCTESHSIQGCADKWYKHQRPADLRPDIPLRKTCRQINHEARNVYFACNIFALVGSGGMDQYEDRHFKVPEMNEIKNVQLTVRTSTILGFEGMLHFSRLPSCRIDDLKGMQKVSKILVRIDQSRPSGYRSPLIPRLPGWILPPGVVPLQLPPLTKPQMAESALKMIADQFETAGSRKVTIHLFQEEEDERDPLKKTHDVRQWLNI